MKIIADDQKLLVGDQKGQLKLLSSKNGWLIKDFGLIHDSIIGIMIEPYQKFFYTSSVDGGIETMEL
jgi:hypothetical protein